MKKRILSLSLALLLIGGMVLPARANSYQGESGWQVLFTNNNKMESNFTTAGMNDSIGDMQPGDDITFTIQVKNENSTTTDWWMTNEVLKSLEDNSPNGASGGAYEYVLKYKSASGTETVLFDSDKVGGEGISDGQLQGLHAATVALEEYFYLDTLAAGESGTVTLKVSLDGETQGNDYQNTLANLQMNFAVELNPDGRRWNLTSEDDESDSEVIQLRDVVRTSDPTDFVPYFIAMGVSGALLLILAIYSLKKRRQGKKEAE